jgi:hypothetical protein
MNSAPTAAWVALLKPATHAAPLDDAAEREWKLFGANRTGLPWPSLEAGSR